MEGLFQRQLTIPHTPPPPPPLFLLQELSEEIKHFSEEVRKLKGENESLSQQLKESYAKLDELSQDSLGKVLEEKFNLQKKVAFCHCVTLN